MININIESVKSVGSKIVKAAVREVPGVLREIGPQATFVYASYRLMGAGTEASTRVAKAIAVANARVLPLYKALPLRTRAAMHFDGAMTTTWLKQVAPQESLEVAEAASVASLLIIKRFVTPDQYQAAVEAFASLEKR